jgi:hypothetical protein
MLVTLFGNVTARASEPVADRTLFCIPPGDFPMQDPPGKVLAVLLNTHKGKEAGEFARGEGLQPGAIFKSTRARLASSHDTLFIVLLYPGYPNSNKTVFWVVRQSKLGATILLSATANCLEIRRTKAHSYNEIVTSSIGNGLTTGVQATTWRYDGRSYRLIRRKSSPPPPNPY